MGWESRGGLTRYYTRSHRVGGRGVREYVGKGWVGLLAAEIDAEARDRRDERREAIRRAGRRLAPLDAMMRELEAGCALLTAATLMAAGYHKHGGEWRLRHDRRGDDGRG